MSNIKDLLTKNETVTTNGQIAFKSTLKLLNDMMAYGVRDSKSFLNAFQQAYKNNPTEALRLLAYTRDCRGGKGEKDLFYSSMKWLKSTSVEDYNMMLALAPFYGCFNDYRKLAEYQAFAELVKKDIQNDSVLLNTTNLAKWMPLCSQSTDGGLKTKPSKAKEYKGKKKEVTKTSDRIPAELAMLEVLGLNHKQYKKLVSGFRNPKSPENQLSRKDYDIDFSKVPSRAMKQYKDAFKEHCEKQYTAFLEKVLKGEAKINSSHVLPYEIVGMKDQKLQQVLWDSEIKRIKDSKEAVNKILFCSDVSGSMITTIKGSKASIMDVSVSLSLMGAELLSDTSWKDLVCLFSEEGKFYDTSKYKTIDQKYSFLESKSQSYNTNVWSVFESSLATAVKNNVPKEDMPEAIAIVSDMQFDSSGRNVTTMTTIRGKFEAAGYSMPTLIFWNVARETDNVPVTLEDDYNVILLSGFSQSLFKKLLFTPIAELNSTDTIVLDIIENERYNKIKSFVDSSWK
jgi:hypothetical protein